MRKSWACVFALTAAACGGAPPHASSAGSITSAPTLGALPDPGVERESMTAHMQMGWHLAANSTLIEMPPLPTQRDAATLTAWSESVLGTWLSQKQRALTEASAELNLAAEEDPRQRIIGGAIVGLIYENAAQSLLSIPTPSELDNEPTVAAAYREMVAFNAAPYLEHARAAYRACSANAEIHEEDVGPTWHAFCAGRLRLLPPGRTPPPAAADDW